MMSSSVSALADLRSVEMEGGESVWGHGGPDRCAGGEAGAQRADCLLLLVLLLDAQA